MDSEGVSIIHNIQAILTIRDNMSATLKTVDNNLNKFGKNLQGKGKELKRFGQTAEWMGKDLLKLAAPFVAVGGWASKLGADYQEVMSQVQAVTRATDTEMEVLQNKAREMGATTSKSAKEAGEAFVYMGQAGLTQQEMLENIEPLIRLSEAGNLDLAKATNLWTNSMKSAEIPLSRTQEYLDNVALASNLSNTNIEQLMEAYKSAGGAIASSNMTIAESSALLGVLANRGVVGTEAGTALSRVFQNLDATGGEAAKAMKTLDISTANSDGTMRNKIEVLQELKGKLDKLTPAQRENYIQMIGGKAHAENLKKMLSGLGDEYGELKGELDNANGALEKMALTMKDNLKGELEGLKSKTEEFGLKLADVLIPRIREVVNKVSGFIDKLNELDEEQLNTIIGIISGVTKLAIFLIIFGKMTKIVGNFKENIGFMMEAFSGTSKISQLIGAPFGKVILIFLAVAVAALLIIKHFDKIKEKVIEVADTINEKTGIIDFIKEKFAELVPFFQNIFEQLGVVFGALITILTPILEFIIGVFKVGIVSAFKTIATVVLGLVEAFITVFGGIVKILSGLLDFIVGVFTGNWSMAWEGVKSIFSGVIDVITGLWNGLVELLSKKVQAVIDILDTIFKDKAQGIKNTWNSIKEFLKHPITGTVKLVKKGAGWVKDKIGGSHRTGRSYIPFDNYASVLHKGEMVLTKQKADEYRKGNIQNNTKEDVSINIGSLAETMVVREEADIDKIATEFVDKLTKVKINTA